MRQAQSIVIATSNRHKVEEIAQLLKPHADLEVLPAEARIRNSEKLSMVETFEKYSENALAKARAANQACHYPCLADDSGLEVDALQGRPGPKSHRYATPVRGLSQDQANIQKLLKELAGVPPEKRTARFVCHLALVIEGISVHAVGTLEGSIALEPRGDQGFGYDPVFIPKGYSQTLAELGAEKKNELSHRSLAIRELMKELLAKDIVLARP